MSSRFQTITDTTASISAGASLNINTTGLPSLFNIVKVKIVPNSGGGSFDYKIFKADTFAAAKLLAHWDNVTPSLFDPMDNSTGSPAEALEGPPIPYDDDDGTGELHHQITNNDSGAHTYTWTIEYEEVPLFAATGEATFRSHIYPAGNNAKDLGDPALKWRTGYFGTAVAVGTNPASAGAVRFANNTQVNWRNAANAADILGLHIDGNNDYTIGNSNARDLYLACGSGRTVYINGATDNVDLILGSDSNLNHFVSDGGAFSGVGAIGFGTVALTSGPAAFVAIDPPGWTATSNQSATRLWVGGSSGVGIPDGTTAPVVATVILGEPNIALGSGAAVTDAYTLYVATAPTEAANNGAAWFATGDVVVGTAALATTATGGFLHIPTCAGTPTGVPANGQSGTVAMVFDTTNNRLYVYDGGWINIGTTT